MYVVNGRYIVWYPRRVFFIGDQIFVRYVVLAFITRLKYYICALLELCANLIIYYTNCIIKSIELSYCIVQSLVYSSRLIYCILKSILSIDRRLYYTNRTVKSIDLPYCVVESNQ